MYHLEKYITSQLLKVYFYIGVVQVSGERYVKYNVALLNLGDYNEKE